MLGTKEFRNFYVWYNAVCVDSLIGQIEVLSQLRCYVYLWEKLETIINKFFILDIIFPAVHCQELSSSNSSVDYRVGFWWSHRYPWSTGWITWTSFVWLTPRLLALFDFPITWRESVFQSLGAPKLHSIWNDGKSESCFWTWVCEWKMAVYFGAEQKVIFWRWPRLW